jgi:hypothetical protein
MGGVRFISGKIWGAHINQAVAIGGKADVKKFAKQ